MGLAYLPAWPRRPIAGSRVLEASAITFSVLLGSMRRRAETLTKLTKVSQVLDFDQPLEQSLRTIANSIREATSFQAVLISIYEKETGMLRRITGVGFPPDTLNTLMSRKQPLTSIQQMIKPQFRNVMYPPME